MDFLSKWKDMKLHIRSIFPEAGFKKVESDKAFFYPEKDKGELYVWKKEINGYKVVQYE